VQKIQMQYLPPVELLAAWLRGWAYEEDNEDLIESLVDACEDMASEHDRSSYQSH